MSIVQTGMPIPHYSQLKTILLHSILISLSLLRNTRQTKTAHRTRTTFRHQIVGRITFALAIYEQCKLSMLLLYMD